MIHEITSDKKSSIFVLYIQIQKEEQKEQI